MSDLEAIRKRELIEKYADAVSEELRTSLRDAVPQLSAADFSELVKLQKSVDWKNVAEKCEETIRNKLGHQFDESWDHLCMKRKIAVLEYLKRRTRNKDISQWRPYNKTPEDQIRPYIMEILIGKNYYLNQYLEKQQQKLIEELVPEVDLYRARIQKINERRELLLSRMSRMEDTNKHNHEFLDDLEQNVRFLRQMNREWHFTDHQVTVKEEKL